jgi:DNA-binding transcriptional regulator PaaX
MEVDSVESRAPGEWVLLSYRMPREPSTPRIAVWRKLKRLGVAQLADGVIALPADARTREHLEWLADEILDGGGTAGIWVARPATASQERELAASMAAARADEYRAIIEEATAAASLPDNARTSTARRLRAEMRRITRRDYFPPPECEHARRAVEGLLQPAATDLAQET